MGNKASETPADDAFCVQVESGQPASTEVASPAKSLNSAAFIRKTETALAEWMCYLDKEFKRNPRGEAKYLKKLAREACEEN